MTPRTPALSRLCLAVLLAAGLSACATEDSAKLAEEPNYGLGYSDGCQTATERDKSFSTKTVRDEALFDSDKGYKAGWRQGYLSCGKRSSQSPDGGRVLGQENQH